jgi:hypothetical protein
MVPPESECGAYQMEEIRIELGWAGRKSHTV